jgi:undecaprenyl-diphosphatase
LRTGDSNDLYLTVNDFARSTGWLHAPVTSYAKYGLLVFAVLLLAGWWVARGRPDRVMAAALLAPLSTVLAVAINQPIIRQVAESRPYVAHPEALVLVSKTTDPSFPSDHAAMAGAVAVGLLLVSRRLGLLASVCALAMAFARVYVGAHYPGDVLAGVVLGATVAVIVWLLLRRPVTILVARLRRTRLSALLGSGSSETTTSPELVASAARP